jgi:hypothetical protein
MKRIKRSSACATVVSFGLAFALSGWLSGGARAAEPAIAAPFATNIAGPSSRLRLSVNLAPLVTGTIGSDLGAFPNDDDADLAFALAPALDYAVNRILFVGLHPQYVFGVKKQKSRGDATYEINLRARIGAIFPARDKVHLFGYLAPGYSILKPTEDLGDVGRPHGFACAAAIGLLADLTPTVFFSSELGYQRGFQKGDQFGFDYAYETSFVGLGFGVGLRL